MYFHTEMLLVGAVAAVGILHTAVPDHWLPISLLARQRHWSKRETARAALQAGTGHVVSTLLIAVIFWLAGAAVAARFGRLFEALTSIALVGFGLWVAVGSWREMHAHVHEDHASEHKHSHGQHGSRTALLLILGSSPMLEGIPAFFAAGRFGFGLLAIMAIVFAASTIATYVLLSVYSAHTLQRVRLGRFERYGETASGLIIAAMGLAFWQWPFM